jgi:D-inositol-3-phosphate glycosyltransferase
VQPIDTSAGAAQPVRRVAMLSLHTSPLEQPGQGDAGGMNVYVLELSRRLAEQGVAVDVFTRATGPQEPAVVEASPDVTVHAIAAGPRRDIAKADLADHVHAFARAVARMPPGRGGYDLVHSHYWLSGLVGVELAARWEVGLVHSMHTMARVKNSALSSGATPEPAQRVTGERRVVQASTALIANTPDEAGHLSELYDADPRRIHVVPPGVDLDVFGRRDGGKPAARALLGLPTDATVLLFVGRLQPLKAPDLLLDAVAVLLRSRPQLRSRLVVPIVGAPSGDGADESASLRAHARRLGVEDVVRFVPPLAHDDLADWYAAATLTCMPSRAESFGLVALESQACGTPVLAARVGGLPVAVDDGVSGVLVEGHQPSAWAAQLAALLDQPQRLDEMGRAAVRHAQTFGWTRTAERTVAVYRAAGRRLPVVGLAASS